jgi:hypothetical protein
MSTLQVVMLWVPAMSPTIVLCLSLCLPAQQAGTSQESQVSDKDVFGIVQKYPTRAGTKTWTSAHWQNATYRLDERRDGNDPQGISGKRGNGMLAVADGVLTMSGDQPRLYVYPYPDSSWRDVEVTAYYQRVADEDVAYAGMVAGIRSGPDGHSDNPCDAHTYYGRMRHDGSFDFAKELKHPRSSTAHRLPGSEAWPDGKLPHKKWIGFKFVGYNHGGKVKLEVYRDLTEGQNGGKWEKVNEATDQGGWFAPTDCPQHHPVPGRSDALIVDGGTVLIRNTNVESAKYRWVSVRQINVAE